MATVGGLDALDQCHGSSPGFRAGWKGRPGRLGDRWMGRVPGGRQQALDELDSHDWVALDPLEVAAEPREVVWGEVLRRTSATAVRNHWSRVAPVWNS